MVELTASQSVSAAFFRSQSTAISSQSSDSSASNRLSLASREQSLVQFSSESSVSIDTDDDTISISSRAEFSFQFSRTTQLVAEQSSGGLLDSPDSPVDTSDGRPLLPEGNSRTNENSIGNTEKLSQRIFEGNVSLLDDFLRENGKSLSEQSLNSFVDLLQETVPEGLDRTRDRLRNEGRLTPENRRKLDEVQSTVIDKLDQFRTNMANRLENGNIRSPDDLSFSDLPGVRDFGLNLTRANSLSLSSKIRISLEVTEINAALVRSEASAKNGSGGSPAKSNEQSGNVVNNPEENARTFSVNSFTQRILDSNLELVNQLFEKTSTATREELLGLLRDSVNRGLRQEEDRLDDGRLSGNKSIQLDQLLTRVNDQLDRLQSVFADGSSQNTGGNGDATSSSNRDVTEPQRETRENAPDPNRDSPAESSNGSPPSTTGRPIDFPSEAIPEPTEPRAIA